jgi:hypothetical protein
LLPATAAPTLQVSVVSDAADPTALFSRALSAGLAELIANTPAKRQRVLVHGGSHPPEIVIRLTQVRSTIVTFAVPIKRIDRIANAAAGYFT